MKEGKSYRAARRNAAKAYAKLVKAKLRSVWEGKAPVKDRPFVPKAGRYLPHQGLREMARRRA